MNNPLEFKLEVHSTVNHERGTVMIWDTLQKWERMIIETKERLAREGLIKLGWTPPGETTRMICFKCRAHNDISANRCWACLNPINPTSAS